MDRSRFDQLTREIAAKPSRRSVIKSALGLMLGAAVGVAAIEESNAAVLARRAGEACRKDGDCLSGTCLPADRAGRRMCSCSTVDHCPPTSSQYTFYQCEENTCVRYQSGLGCFVAGTQIAIPGGASRGIEFFMPGDEVINSNGTTNRVLELERRPLANRMVYAINDGDFFFSPEHVFMTEAGWRAIDAEGAQRDDPTIVVQQLRVGDVLYAMAPKPVYALAGGGQCELPAVAEPFRVTSLTGRWAPPQTDIYNILLDGDMTYFANGLLVHD